MNTTYQNWHNLFDVGLKCKCEWLCENPCWCDEFELLSNKILAIWKKDIKVLKLLQDYHWNVMTILKSQTMIIEHNILTELEVDNRRRSYVRVVDILLQLSPQEIITIVNTITSKKEKDLNSGTDHNTEVVERIFWQGLFSWKKIIEILLHPRQ